MITYNFIDVTFPIDEERYNGWISSIVKNENKSIEEINYIFCNDDYLHDLNIKFLNHDTYTDIITFDNSLGDTLISDIFISLDRVKENATSYNVCYEDEVHRVMAHGVLHLCGYKDKVDQDIAIMRIKEDEAIDMFHVER